MLEAHKHFYVRFSVNRSRSCFSLLTATFAASLVTSPALGAYLEQMYNENVVVAVATIVAILDVLFIILAVPESLPDKCKPSR